MRIPCLSLTPPWGTLIAIAEAHPELGKHVETRSWRTQYRGWLGIHQTKGLGEFASEAAMWDLALAPPFGASLLAGGYGNPGRLPRGAVVAVARLEDVVRIETNSLGWGRSRYWILDERERAFGNYAPGRYGWLLADIRALPQPVPARGQAGLWWWDVPAPLEPLLTGEVTP